MNDNARPHVARIVDEFLHDVGLNRMAWPARSLDINPIEHMWVFHDVGLNRMVWPARSPDINPIEHVWGLLGKRVRSRLTPHSNLQQLRNVLSKEWNSIDQTDIQNMIERLNRRMVTVIQSAISNIWVATKSVEHLEENKKIWDSKGYCSVESIITEDKDPAEKLNISLEYLNSITPSGMSPHKFILKVGAIVMLIRNMNLASGLFNGVRMMIPISPVVLYCCETWTLERRTEIKGFENKVLRKIFGAKKDEVTVEWRKLHNAELHALYSSRDIIRNIKSRCLRWAGYVARMGESRIAYKVLVGRSEEKRPLGRPRRRWEDDIKMDVREVGYDDRNWINLAQDKDRWRAYMRATMNLRVS
ncbi:hypothetical protein ANN_00946 [Periplaneta americana]|uniref:DNA helicase Pif1-like 2B domain-containing protein n=1 Tax=Periplaneta americana TaxID=6978 RepID=A0ABQ8TS94_PERAM|nr:hypothetical protein ANN_00946 [Periplaneta americana]